MTKRKQQVDLSGTTSDITLWHSLLERETLVIADELHNDLAQVLLALRLEIALFQLQGQSDQVLIQKTGDWLIMADRCMQTLSGLINTMHTPSYHQGLAHALDYLTQSLFHRHQIPCQLLFDYDGSCLAQVHVMLLFRFVYEALNNVVKHAMANAVKVTVSQTSTGGFELTVSDDGLGFEPSTINTDKKLGLTLMKAYADALSGQLSIESSPSNGSKIVLTIPKGVL